MLGQQRQDLVKLEHRAWPPMRDQQRHRVGLARGLMNEMQIDAANADRKWAKAVEFCLPRAPVKPALPIIGKQLHVSETGARGPWGDRRLRRPARARKTRLQLGNMGVRNM